VPQHRQVASLDQHGTAGLVQRVEHVGDHRKLGHGWAAAMELGDSPKQLVDDARHPHIVPSVSCQQRA